MVFSSCVYTLTAYVIEDTELVSLLWLPYFHCNCNSVYFCRVFLHLLLLAQTSTSFSINMREREIQKVRICVCVCVCMVREDELRFTGS